MIATYIRALGNHDGIFDQPASSAIGAFAKLGSVARDAVPVLQRLSQATNISDTIRGDVTDALKRIR